MKERLTLVIYGRGLKLVLVGYPDI